jgi:AraC family transcriptional activator FtrA
LVIPPHRDGGQAQFLERPVENIEQAPGQRASLAALLDRIRKRLGEPWRIADLARHAAMSERTFMRRFREITGSSPAGWITQARVDRARELLECTALPIGRIAEQCGLGTPTTLRHHFRKKVGVSPAAYRRRFSETPS